MFIIYYSLFTIYSKKSENMPAIEYDNNPKHSSDLIKNYSSVIHKNIFYISDHNLSLIKYIWNKLTRDQRLKIDIEKSHNKTDLMKFLHIKWQKMNKINN